MSKELSFIRYKLASSMPVSPFLGDSETISFLRNSLNYLNFMEYVGCTQVKSDIIQYSLYKCAPSTTLTDKRRYTWLEIEAVGYIQLHKKQPLLVKQKVKDNWKIISDTLDIVHPGCETFPYFFFRSQRNRGLGDHGNPQIQYFYYMLDNPYLHILKLSVFNEWPLKALCKLTDIVSLNGLVAIFRSKKAKEVQPLFDYVRLGFKRSDGCRGEIFVCNEKKALITQEMKNLGYKVTKVSLGFSNLFDVNKLMLLS
jgi:hypothetical protein